jgi:hypothetical protein
LNIIIGIGIAVEIGKQQSAAIPDLIATPIPMPTPIDFEVVVLIINS